MFTCICHILLYQELYQSSAEPLPKAPSQIDSHFDADILHNYAKDGQDEDWGPWLNAENRLHSEDNEHWDPDRPQVDVAMMRASVAADKVVGLPVRFLGKSTLWELYWMFVAARDLLRSASEGVGVSGSLRKQTCPSFATF